MMDAEDKEGSRWILILSGNNRTKAMRRSA
jgi:hypothetical protein